MEEVRLAIESVAVHVPGSMNVTPDALSRYFFNTEFRDRMPDRTLRKRLFRMLQREVGLSVTLDGMAADDGHNALVSKFCSPSNPLFEENLEGHSIWLFPPLELIGITLKFLVNQRRLGIAFSCCVPIPEHTSAYWYKYLTNFRPVKRFCTGADLFRILRGGGFVRAHPVKENWRVVLMQ